MSCHRSPVPRLRADRGPAERDATRSDATHAVHEAWLGRDSRASPRPVSSGAAGGGSLVDRTCFVGPEVDQVVPLAGRAGHVREDVDVVVGPLDDLVLAIVGVRVDGAEDAAARLAV